MGFFNLSAAGEQIRKPAVAGQFYPGDAKTLRSDVEGYIAGGSRFPAAPRLIISPHAGYVFSGPVAGKGYAALDRSVKTVILIGPSHHAYFEGVAVPGASAFQTPLGTVQVDNRRMKELRASPLVKVNDAAHGPEHSLEVQIPFLQVLLADFKIVPLLTGKVTPQQVADLVYPLIDGHTAVIASSDFSHYLQQKEARSADDRSIATVMSGNTSGSLDACGEMPVRVVMLLAKRMGLSPKLIDARTSFETAPQYGSDDRVVGYASIVFLPSSIEQKAPPAASPAGSHGGKGGLTPEEKAFLLKLARQGLEASVKGGDEPSPQSLPVITKENRGCFVTLTIRGELRGCIGYIEPIKPLYRAVIENVRNAALSDPRFSPVSPSELSSIKVEVSVLTLPEPLPYKDPDDLLSKLVPGVDGIILQKGPYQSTFLPQVWEQLPDKVAFLEHLSLKGGMARDGWKSATVKRYRAEHFSE